MAARRSFNYLVKSLWIINTISTKACPSGTTLSHRDGIPPIWKGWCLEFKSLEWDIGNQ
jgi:hypothetical protein